MLPFKRGESFLAPWFVCLLCVLPGPWCVGPACAFGFWSCRLVLLAGLALRLRRPGLSPSGGLLPGPLVGSGRLALSSGVFLALFFLLFERGDDPGHRPKDRLFRRATTQGPIFKQVSPLTAVTVFYGRGIGGIGLFSSRASMVFQSVLAFSEVLRNGSFAVNE